MLPWAPGLEWNEDVQAYSDKPWTLPTALQPEHLLEENVQDLLYSEYPQFAFIHTGTVISDYSEWLPLQWDVVLKFTTLNVRT